MQKSFLQNIAFLVLVNLIVKPFWILGIDRTVQNTVGHELYGSYQAMFNIAIIFNIILDFGLHAYSSRVVAQSPSMMQGLLPNIALAKAFFSLVYLGITLGYGFLQGVGSLHFKLLLILSLMQIVLSYLQYFRSNIAALQRFKTDGIFSVLDRIIAILILGAILYTPLSIGSSFNIEWYAWVQVLAYSLAAVAACWLCLRLQKLRSVSINWKKIWVIVRHSIPYALLVFCMSVYMRIDVVMLEYISHDTSIAGRYAAAFRLLDVCNNMSGVLLGSMLLPLFARMIAQKQDLGSIVHLCVTILLPLAIMVAVVAYFRGADIMQWLYKDVRSEDGRVLFLLMCCYPFYCINYIYATLLTANGNLRILIGISALAVLLNVVLNITFLSARNADNGWWAALNACLTLAFVALANMWFSYRKMGLALPWILIMRVLLFAALFVLLNVVMVAFLHWSLVPSLVLSVVGGIGLVFAVGIIRPGVLLIQIKQILQGR